MAKYIDIEPIIERGIATVSMVASLDYARGYNELYKALCEAPSVSMEPVVHAKWKRYNKQGIAVCTHCSFERKLDHDFGKAIFCPNCGAKMDLEKGT